MRPALSSLRTREVAIRMAADFAIVHMAAFASLTAVLLWRLWETPGTDGRDLANVLARIYLTHFLPLSVLFPVVFTASGFYSVARGYRTPYKWRAIGTASPPAALVYLFTDFVWHRANIL